MRKTHLPIAQPCHENWDAMDPVERGRFCNSCSKQVYHLSGMTEREAREVLEQSACSGEKICVRYSCDRQGVIQFKRERTVAAAAAVMLTAALAACSPHENPDYQRTSVLPVPPVEVETQTQPEIMGAIAPVPPPMMGEPAIDPELIEPESEPVEVLMGDVAYEPEEEEPQPCALTKPGNFEEKKDEAERPRKRLKVR